MPSIKLDITNCTKCPNFKSYRIYAPDSFEVVSSWHCGAKENKTINEYVEWYDEVKIPDWCPIIIKENDK